MNIGLNSTVRQQIAQNLNMLLADSYVLYAKAQNCYWNIVDAHFYSIHLFLKNELEKLNRAHEEIAIRIRILGEHIPCSLKHLLNISSLKESDKEATTEELLQELLHDHETICCFIRDRITLVAKLGDEGTIALLIQRLCAHEQSVWMLRSQLCN